MSTRFARPSHLVDINEVPDLAHITAGRDGLTIGALVRHASIERRGDLGPSWAALYEAAPYVGHFPIRMRGTFGGSISHAEPTAEFPLVALTLEATMVVESTSGAREIPAETFFTGPLTTQLAANEVLREVRFHAPPPGAKTAFEEFSERAGDFALAAVCVGLSINSGVCDWARVGIGAVGPVPVRCYEAEEILHGSPLNDEVIKEAAQAARRGCNPPSTHFASSEFRRDLVGVLLERAAERILCERDH